jgi:hypothetical protein
VSNAQASKYRGAYVSRFSINALERIRIASCAPDAPHVAYEVRVCVCACVRAFVCVCVR